MRVKPSPFVSRKTLAAYWFGTKGRGEPCQQGETAARSGCVPQVADTPFEQPKKEPKSKRELEDEEELRQMEGSSSEPGQTSGVEETVRGLKSHTEKLKLTSKQKTAVDDYATPMSFDLNEALRKGKEPEDRDLRDLMRDLDSVFATAPDFPEPVIVYRGLRFKSPAEAEDFGRRLTESGEVEMPAYVSTSVDPDIARKFSSGDDVQAGAGVTLEIVARKGIYAESISEAARRDGFQEVVLPRGGRFRVVGRKHTETGEVYQVEQM